ncbi:GNAT family N-acetyltransferase [Psychrobacillus sp. Sa2BUA9]|uniref:GNAT family N-acetyltransferase n=1 Tax=Psychrobacillus faecigallinarum TaxID=2762235 RepID=A0ABR8RCW8_9BACI|nr:GNAT family protein [Psychrobacillus faecigallinarum]MBD7945634.1 GNAT family N-acetyltransferase [Psychrobacillus faecigallinarum]QGM29268.1 GNAT family N-acetyltransferase [Bacillus sp. N3536]
MSYTLQPMTQNQANVIAYSWHYEEPYSFYDMEADKEDLEEFLNPISRGDSYFVVLEHDEIIGFFSFTSVSPGEIDIGLGMRPDLTGRGRGLDFLQAGMQFALNRFQPTIITLSVAAFNKRAIGTYKKIGFEKVSNFLQDTNGGSYEFVKMIYKTAKE